MKLQKKIKITAPNKPTFYFDIVLVKFHRLFSEEVIVKFGAVLKTENKAPIMPGTSSLTEKTTIEKVLSIVAELCRVDVAELILEEIPRKEKACV